MSLTKFNEEEFVYNRRREGFEEGAHQTRIETARNSLNLGLNFEQVSKISGLSIGEIKSIQM